MTTPHLELITREPKSPSDKPPVLFVHGAWHGAWCWEENFLDYFAAKGHTAIAFSLRGHGASSGKERLRLTRLRHYIEDVKQIVDSLPSAPIIVGHSMGGFVVKKYLEIGSAKAAALMTPVPPRGPWGLTWRMFRQHPLLVLKCYLTLRLYHMVRDTNLIRTWFFSEDIPKEQLSRYASKIQDESFLVYVDMLFSDWKQRPRADIPVTVLGAKNDQIFPPAEVNATASSFGIKAHFFDGMAHDLMLEKNWQEVADHIIDWSELNTTSK